MKLSTLALLLVAGVAPAACPPKAVPPQQGPPLTYQLVPRADPCPPTVQASSSVSSTGVTTRTVTTTTRTTTTSVPAATMTYSVVPVYAVRTVPAVPDKKRFTPIRDLLRGIGGL